MTFVILIVLNIITLGLLTLSFVIRPKSSLTAQDIIRTMEKENDRMRKSISMDMSAVQQLFRDVNNILIETMRNNNQNTIDTLKLTAENDNERLKRIEGRLMGVTDTVDKKLETMFIENKRQLGEIKETVDEKLNVNLTTRLNESFSIISERLEQLYKGFGEIGALTSGVTDLKRMLSNVKVRGTFGEVQLHNLLEQMLAANQYIVNAEIRPKSGERADFAIIMPGKDEQSILLPIDVKFPIEDYLRLVDFCDKNMAQEAQIATRAIERRIRDEAKKIRDKYIVPPHSTDFAIMYLPIEGLYAEVLRMTGVVEQIQREYKIIICGPTTITALLSSLQMGFKTLYIEKRSSEIWQLLASFRHEFEAFIELLARTQKKLNEAGEGLDAATKKTVRIQKQLNKVAAGAPGFLTENKSDEEEEK